MYANVFCCMRYCNSQYFIILMYPDALFRSLTAFLIYITFILWNIIDSNFILLWNQSYVLYANCNFVILILLWNSFYTGYGVTTTRPFKNTEDLLECKGTLVSRDEGKKLHQNMQKRDWNVTFLMWNVVIRIYGTNIFVLLWLICWMICISQNSA